jgi:hypothetical protein
MRISGLYATRNILGSYCGRATQSRDATIIPHIYKHSFFENHFEHIAKSPLYGDRAIMEQSAAKISSLGDMTTYFGHGSPAKTGNGDIEHGSIETERLALWELTLDDLSATREIVCDDKTSCKQDRRESRASKRG